MKTLKKILLASTILFGVCQNATASSYTSLVIDGNDLSIGRQGEYDVKIDIEGSQYTSSCVNKSYCRREQLPLMAARVNLEAQSSAKLPKLKLYVFSRQGKFLTECKGPAITDGSSTAWWLLADPADHSKAICYPFVDSLPIR